MKKLLLVLGALLVMAGIVSTNFWRHLRAERQANAELRTQIAEAKVAAPAPAPLEQSIAIPAPAAVPDKPAAAACASPAADNFNPKATLAMVIAGASLAGSGAQDLLKNPEYRKAELTVARLKQAQSNPGLAEALGLSATEGDRLFEVMAEGQLKTTAELNAAIVPGVVTPLPGFAEVQRLAEARNEPIRAMLGEAKFAQYQDFQRTVRPALTQVASLGSTLTAAGQPLTEAQSRALTAALTAEQRRQMEEAALPRANPAPGAPRGIVQTLEENDNRQTEADRRILEAAASSLNPAQLAALREQFEKQAASRRRTLDTAREQMDSRRQ